MTLRNQTAPPRKSFAAPRRNGLTLFELLLALAIFLTSLAALAQLLASGARAAAQSQLQTEAILRCESKLGELVSGIVPIETVSNKTFEDDPRWSWRLTVADGNWPSLKLVELEVSHTGRNSLGNSSYTLRRYVRDPRLFVDVAPRQLTPIPSRGERRTRREPAPQSQRGASDVSESEDSDE